MVGATFQNPSIEMGGQKICIIAPNGMDKRQGLRNAPMKVGPGRPSAGRLPQLALQLSKETVARYMTCCTP